MPVSVHHIVVDTHDLPGLARFWAAALHWEVLSERPREVVVGPALDAPIGMCFMPVDQPKTTKNRLHLDLTTSADDRDSGDRPPDHTRSYRALTSARRGTESWTVLADPEGNEFCVVRPKSDPRAG